MTFLKPLTLFLEESNKIESTTISEGEVECVANILKLDEITTQDVANYVLVTAGHSAQIRSLHGMDVMVGNHRAVAGGPSVVNYFKEIIEDVNIYRHEEWWAWDIHHEYETLHPFMDGNGRSGRLIWLWMMYKGTGRVYDRFLQFFYYQSLQFRSQ